MRGKAKLCLTIVACCPWAAWAQHANDDPVVSAEDGFGFNVGLEGTGIYGPGGVRGFNPQSAGNVRINGLYFDQQGSLSNRVIEDSTIRVGLSTINYPFPAPTGIVDYALRQPIDGRAGANIITEIGPFQNRSLSIDGSVPLTRQLVLPIGVEYALGAPVPSGPNAGYGSKIANVGLAPQWKPNENVTVRAFFDWEDQGEARTLPYVFTAGNYLPPQITRGFLGQQWALDHYIYKNYGALVDAKLSPQWSLKAGLFRSISDTPVSYADLFLDVQPDGSADHVMVASPDQVIRSSSGEVRLTGHFEHKDGYQDLVFLARGRDEIAHYGGSAAVDVGQAFIGSGAQVPEPAFAFTARTDDHTRLWSTGVAWQLRQARIGELSLGAQKEFYDKTVAAPGQAPSSLYDSPWRFYGNVSAPIVGKLVVFSSYTQGFEDSGIAPNTAANRNAILPTTRTWQADAGLRYPVTSKLALIAGVFRLDKPYFNLDTGNVDRQLGTQQATGLELSLAGEAFSGMYVNAGALIGRVKVAGPDLAAEGVGGTALGQPHDQFQLNLDYTLPWYKPLSFDLGVYHFGSAPANVSNGVYASEVTQLALGGRYRFKLWGAPATLRVQGQNLTNTYIWNIGYVPGFVQFAPRSALAYLTIDI